jgi:CubicO group peptidase (beta-lactamase class C family)
VAVVLKVDVPPAMIRGEADEGYGPVADAFRRNYAKRGEVGAACAVYRDGVKVVDLWGGYRDGVTRDPWREDTVVLMNSTTKGVASLALAVAHSRGLFDLDRAVAEYWPQFAWMGKAEITVRQLLAHQAGLPVVDVPLEVGDLADLDLMAAALAVQRPLWPPGTRHGYHGITLGWYEAELLRRLDPAGRSLGRFLAEEIADPLGAAFVIGVPQGFDLARRATIHGRGPYESLLHARELPPRFLLALLSPSGLFRRAFGNPRDLLVDTNYNRPDVLAVEIPAGNGLGEPRAVAAMYSAAITGGLGLTAQTLSELSRPAQPPSGGPIDLVLRVPTAFGFGCFKPTDGFPFGGAGNQAFGTPGAGGSFGFADPETGIGYCYAPNRLGFGLTDERELALRDALFKDVLGERPQSPGRRR